MCNRVCNVSFDLGDRDLQRDRDVFIARSLPATDDGDLSRGRQFIERGKDSFDPVLVVRLGRVLSSFDSQSLWIPLLPY